MNDCFKITLAIWGIALISGFASAILDGNYIFNVLVVLSAGFLSLFYFYGSALYFTQLPFSSFLKEFNKVRRHFKIISLFLGIPFALSSISLIFIVLEFPGGTIVYALSIIFSLLIIAYVKFGGRIEIEKRKFINYNYRAFIAISILVLIILIVKWPSSAIEMKWVEPTTIPGM